MLQLAQSIARLTAQRSRLALDRAALDLVAQLVPGARIEMLRCVGAAADLRLLLTARAAHGVVESLPAPAGAVDALPPLNAEPLYVRALREHEPVLDYACGRHVFSLDLEAGCFALMDLRLSHPMSTELITLVQTLLGIYKNQVTLLNYGETDALTGLLNRKTYDAVFYEAAQATAAGEQCSPTEPERRTSSDRRWLGVVDIDHFKRVNDSHGHLIGDELLLLVSQLMRASFRFDDALYRFGGEEFVILLRAPARDHARAAFERLRKRLAAYEFPRVGTVTASIGYTAIRDLDLPSSAFERADRAVYFAKENGRNQTRCFDELLAGGDVDARDHVGEVELF
jgi:diguanylate cyclase (GGDEF)-like protein